MEYDKLKSEIEQIGKRITETESSKEDYAAQIDQLNTEIQDVLKEEENERDNIESLDKLIDESKERKLESIQLTRKREVLKLLKSKFKGVVSISLLIYTRY